MDPARWQRIEELCHAAEARDEAHRAAFLDEACGDDRDLRDEVESLLAARSGAEGFLESPAVEHAEISSGTRLGHYVIEALIGEGGMGRVYRARDTKLGRQVALKVLPDSLASRPIDRERFDREARAIAALSHPNIVTLYSAEEDTGVRFLTMELVEGKPLSALLPRRGFQLGELLKLATPLADAVHAAHAKEIVHRDLKPANIMVTADGQLRVLDFGLAKLRAAVGESGEATTQEATSEGRIVGTVAYMSPEQAEGKPLDHRTDIFSLGVVLYEMATGRRPFMGDTSASVMSSVIKDDPKSVRDVNPAVPAPLARVIKMCLRKDPDRRYQSAKDVRNELAAIHEESISGELEASVEVVRSGWRRSALPVVAAVAVVAIGAAFYFGVVSGPAPRSLTNFEAVTTTGREFDPSISPDGQSLLYVSSASGNPDIYRLRVGGSIPINLTEDHTGGDSQPDWSPDGQSIAFRSGRDGGGLFVMGATGESPRRVAEVGVDPDWSPDGTKLVFARSRPARLPTNVPSTCSLWTVDVLTGEEELLIDGQGFHPAWSPDGRFIAYWWKLNIWVISAGGGTPVQVTDVDAPESPVPDWRPAWSHDGRSLYYASERGGSMNLWRVRIDSDTGGPAGEPEALWTPAHYLDRISISADGRTFALRFRTIRSNVYRIEYDAIRSEVVGDPQPITEGLLHFTHVDPSPDGGRLALAKTEIGQEDIWVSRADGTGLRQVTDDSFFDRDPNWSPDGRRIAYYSNRGGLSTKEATFELWTVNDDGSSPRRLTWGAEDEEFGWAFYPRWSPGTPQMVYSNFGPGAAWLLDLRRPWTESKPERLPAASAHPNAHLYPGRRPWSADGTNLLGAVGNSQQNRGIFTFDLDTNEYTLVSDQGLGGGRSASWLNDGRILLLSGGRLVLLDPTTKTHHTLLSPDEGERFLRPVPSADNQYIYYLVRSEESSIWIADLEGGR